MRVASLFSGIGGFEEGFNLANLDYEVVFASEIDKYARISYSANFNADELVGDIKEIDEFDIPDHDFLIAGFPCQSFSIAGDRKGFDDIRGTLFFDIVRVLKAKKPKMFLLENVKNLVGHDNGNTIKTILQNLSTIGYTIDFEILNSKDSGVAQSRERTYIVGVFNYPTEKFYIDSKHKRTIQTKKWCNDENLNTFNFFKDFSQSSKDTKYIENILENNVDQKYYFDNKDLMSFINSKKFEKIENSNEIIKVLDLPKEIHNDFERQRRVYSIKGISPTILARTDSAKILIEEKGTKRIRKTTPLENFLMQGFSIESVKKIKNTGMSDTQLYKQAGNAVSPPVIRDIINHLFDKDIEYVSNNKFRFIDLFSGIGGFRIAMESLGGECVFSSEIDQYAIETYYENFNETPSGDIEKIDESSIPDHDVLCAGFPCQPFSIGGLRKGFEDTRGTLFFDVSRIINEKKPKIVFLENVSGIVSHDKGNTIKVITETLEELGYNVYTKIMNAKDYGVPQNRNRWYCVAVKKEYQNKFIFPEKQELNYYVRDIISNNSNKDYKITKTARENISKFIEEFKENQRYDAEHTLLANEVRKSRCNFRSDGISPCLTAKMGTGGNNVPIIVEEDRKLTERECLSLMGFPSWYKITPNKLQSYKQIGNSVVVPVIRKIGENIVEELNKM